MTAALALTGTFLDEISHDIPPQNWGAAEWERDFQAMGAIGIDTVVLIRSGYRRWLTYPSDVLISKSNCYLMSPNSCYLQAGHLYNRYREHFGL
jgi:hypothetical protein